MKSFHTTKKRSKEGKLTIKQAQLRTITEKETIASFIIIFIFFMIIIIKIIIIIITVINIFD